VIVAGTIRPAVNQVQFSALRYRRALLDAGRRRNVALEAYSPLGRAHRPFSLFFIPNGPWCVPPADASQDDDRAYGAYLHLHQHKDASRR
jgi:hypothetical protein